MLHFRLTAKELRISPEFGPKIQIPAEFKASIHLPESTNFGKTGEKIRISAQLSSNYQVQVHISDQRFTLLIENKDEWQLFLQSNIVDLLDAIITAFISPNEELLCIKQTKNDSVWIFGFVYENQGILGYLLKRSKPDIDSTFALNTQNIRQIIQHVYFNFHSWLSSSAPLIQAIKNGSSSSRLTVKVNSFALWFLHYPLSYFTIYNFGRFPIYRDIETVVTDKSLVKNSVERLNLRRDFTFLPNILNHSVVIINTYNHHLNHSDNTIKEDCEEGTGLLIKILSLLQDIWINDRPYSMRWYLNPSKQEIFQEFSNPNTRYVFCDFHVTDGKWQFGQGENLSYTGSDDNGEDYNYENCDIVDELTHTPLKHIKLLRAYHCGSIHDPYEFNQPPADHSTIVRKYLNAGVQRVEGCLTKDSYFSFLCTTLKFFLDSQGLRFPIYGKMLNNPGEFDNLIINVQNYLAKFGYCLE